MGFVCTPQITGLIRGEPKTNAKGGKQKHRHNGCGWLMECLKERKSRSETLDRSQTVNNDYHGLPKSAAEVWDDVLASAEAYRVEGMTKKGKTFSRKLRQDAVVGVGVIIHPPTAVSKTWDDETYTRFVDDSMDVLHELQPRLFAPVKTKARVTHRDEDGNHDHIYFEATDDDGRYCGNLVDAAFLVRVNQRYPEMMRERGWDLDDLDVTDWRRYKEDDDYRRERQEKRKAQGLDPSRVKAIERREQAVSEREQVLAQRERVLAEREQIVTSHEETLQTLMDEAHEARKEHMRAVSDCEKAAQQATVGGADPVEFAQFVLQECAFDQERASRTNGARFLRSIQESGEYLRKVVKRALQKMFVPKAPNAPAVRRRIVDEPQEQGAQDDGPSL